MRLAINYQLLYLYPRWLFLWDFPPSQLQNLARRTEPDQRFQLALLTLSHHAPDPSPVPEEVKPVVSACALL